MKTQCGKYRKKLSREIVVEERSRKNAFAYYLMIFKYEHKKIELSNEIFMNVSTASL
jgi:hypothetical protein